MNSVAANTSPSLDSLSGNRPVIPDPITANPLRRLHRDAWCQPEDLLTGISDRTENPERAKSLRNARYAVSVPEELALALAFATQELLPAGSVVEAAERSILEANQDFLEASTAGAGTLRKARLLTQALEAWDASPSRRHLHVINVAVYEMMGLAVDESRLRDRVDAVLEDVVAEFLEEIPEELAMRHILFLKACEDARFLPLFELEIFPLYRPMAGHIRSMADFLKLSTWLLESPRFVANGPENPEEVEALMSTAQDCRDDLEFWVEQEQVPFPSENLQREVRTRITLLALVVALRSRMWQDATRLIAGFQMEDLRAEKDLAGAQTLQFTLEIVPLIALHQVQPQTDLSEKLDEAAARLPEVTELIGEIRDAFCQPAPQVVDAVDTESTDADEAMIAMEVPVPQVQTARSNSLHAIPQTPLPMVPHKSDRRGERRKVVAKFIQEISEKDSGERKKDLQTTLHKIRPTNPELVESDALKDVETEERRKLLGKRVAEFDRTGASGNHRRRSGLMDRLKSPQLMGLSALFAVLVAIGGAGYFLTQNSPAPDAPQVGVVAANDAATVGSGSREVDLTAAPDHGQPAALLTGWQPQPDVRADGPKGSQTTMEPDDFQVKKIIYFTESGQTGEVKAAHINDWVYREGEELVDFSTGARVAFQVVKIEPAQVILRNQVQELQLPLVMR